MTPLKPGWEKDWPRLGAHNGRLSSDETPDYNCLAFAAGRTDEWWEPYEIPPADPGIYWPAGVHPDNRVEDWAAALATVGFEPCADGRVEPGFVKVALFGRGDGFATHAARQLLDGRWTSKLGSLEDIEHDEPATIIGPLYGSVRMWLRRPRNEGEP